MGDEQASRRWQWVLGAALLGHVVLGLYFVERVALNGDEGWYLYAAHRVAEGARLHRDLTFFQGPVLPHVYGGMTAPGPGSLLAGRWLSLVFLMLGTGLSALTALRVGGRRGAALALVVVAIHPLIVAAGVWIKTYALATMLLSAGLFLLAGPGARAVRAGVGVALIALAVGTRISLLPVLLAAVALAPRRLVAAAGALLGLVLVSRPVWGTPLDVLAFHWVGFHLGTDLPGDGAGWLLTRLGLGLNGALAFLAVIGVAGLARPWRERAETSVERIALWGLFGTTALHFLPRETHVEHLVVTAPLIAVVLSGWSRWLPDRARTWAVLAVLIAAGGLSSLRWVALDRGGSSLSDAMELGRWLRTRTPADAQLLTLETALAVESGRRLPPGFEMGRFGWRPDADAGDVDRLGLLDEAGVHAALSGPIGAVALGSRDFEDRPAVRAAVQAALQQLPVEREEEAFGQFGLPLVLGAGRGPTVWVPEEVP